MDPLEKKIRDAGGFIVPTPLTDSGGKINPECIDQIVGAIESGNTPEPGKEPTDSMQYNSSSQQEETKHLDAAEWRDRAEKLWQLLDDIDTASDMFKPEKNAFFGYAMRKAEERGKYIFSPDGYRLVATQRNESESVAPVTHK
jgi:hypothetical protein